MDPHLARSASALQAFVKPNSKERARLYPLLNRKAGLECEHPNTYHAITFTNDDRLLCTVCQAILDSILRLALDLLSCWCMSSWCDTWLPHRFTAVAAEIGAHYSPSAVAGTPVMLAAHTCVHLPAP